MTPDEIVRGLRAWAATIGFTGLEEAADLIERQVKALEEAEKALEPFEEARRLMMSVFDGRDPSLYGVYPQDLHTASVALAAIRAARGEKEKRSSFHGGGGAGL